MEKGFSLFRAVVLLVETKQEAINVNIYVTVLDQKTKTIISIADDIFLNGNPHTYNKTQTPNKKDNMVCMFPEMRLFVLHQKNKKYLKQ